MDYPRADRGEIFKLAVLTHDEDLREYAELWLKSELDEEEISKLEALYTKAESTSLLNFAITEIDRILGEKVGLVDPDSIRDQQAWLREHLDQVPLEETDLLATQRFLYEVGFYQGPLDGVWGSRSRYAATQYRMKVQQLLHQRGLYQGNIDGEFGNLSVTAVQEFQNSHRIRDDGVPLRKTFELLSNE